MTLTRIKSQNKSDVFNSSFTIVTSGMDAAVLLCYMDVDQRNKRFLLTFDLSKVRYAYTNGLGEYRKTEAVQYISLLKHRNISCLLPNNKSPTPNT